MGKSKVEKEGTVTFILSVVGINVLDGNVVVDMSYPMAKRLWFDRDEDMELTLPNGKRMIIAKDCFSGINES